MDKIRKEKTISLPLRTWLFIELVGWLLVGVLAFLWPKGMCIYMPLMAVLWLLGGAVTVRWLQKV